eukprot:INCI12549.1.p1 GENE.INCI12549.1~~INCI12549.1.p1  ORF type:complete len:111 (-),score=13.14 INCI12549.1:130-462(-)
MLVTSLAQAQAQVMCDVGTDQFFSTTDCGSSDLAKCCECFWVYQAPYVDTPAQPFRFCWPDSQPCSDYHASFGNHVYESSIDCSEAPKLQVASVGRLVVFTVVLLTAFLT